MKDVLNPIKPDLMLSVSNKVEVSAMDFKKTVDAQAENELRSLLQQEDLFTKNLFWEKLKKEVSEKIGAFLNQLSSEQIKKIYEGLSEQDKSDLEKVFELAKLENDLHKMKQREINALIDLTKAGLNDLNHQVLGKVTELYAQGNYQQALDTAMILASKGVGEVQVAAYQAIKNILKNTPQEESLKFLDKTLSLLDRKAWIQKMEQNIVAIRSEKDSAAYKDTTIKQTSAFELDTTKAAQEISEKKALKKASKELQKILKKLNDASALSFMEKQYMDIRLKTHEEVSDRMTVDQVVSKAYLLKNGYLPKNGKEIKDSELQAMKNLFYYKWNYTEDAGKKNQAENQAYEQIKLTKIAGVSMAEVHQAKEIMNQISTSPREAIKVLLGDKNRDGKITNITSEQ